MGGRGEGGSCVYVSSMVTVEGVHDVERAAKQVSVHVGKGGEGGGGGGGGVSLSLSLPPAPFSSSLILSRLPLLDKE